MGWEESVREEGRECVFGERVCEIVCKSNGKECVRVRGECVSEGRTCLRGGECVCVMGRKCLRGGEWLCVRGRKCLGGGKSMWEG